MFIITWCLVTTSLAHSLHDRSTTADFVLPRACDLETSILLTLTAVGYVPQRHPRIAFCGFLAMSTA